MFEKKAQGAFIDMSPQRKEKGASPLSTRSISIICIA